MSVGGGGLSFPEEVILLFHCGALCVGPKHVAPKSVTPSGFTLVLRFSSAAGCAVAVDSKWMKPMRAAVSPHVPEFLHLGAPAVTLAATTFSTVGIDVLAIELVGYAGNGGG